MNSKQFSIDEVVEMRRRDKTWDEIGEYFGVKRQWMAEWASRQKDFPRELLWRARPGGPISAEMIHEVVEDMGMSDERAADHFGMKVGAFQKLRVRRGVFRRKDDVDYSRKTPEELAEAERLLDEGYSYHAVSGMTSVGEKSLSNHFPGRGFNLKQTTEAAAMGRKLAKLAA